jgi:hypothetical protein
MRSWNAFGAEIDEKLVRRTANRIVELGLRDAGYRWAAAERPASSTSSTIPSFPFWLSLCDCQGLTYSQQC